MADDIDGKIAIAHITLDLLLRAKPPSKLGLPMGLFGKDVENLAVDCCTFNGWMRLIDVNMLEGKEGFYRIFITTPEGERQINLLSDFFANSSKKSN